MSSHFTIPNFKYGLDSRRSELTSLPGTLLQCLDGHINQGAQIENRKAFVKLGQLPASCFGLQETPTGLVTFGSTAVGGVVIPAGLTGLVSYQRLRHYTYELAAQGALIPVPGGGTVGSLNPNSTYELLHGSVEPAMTGITHSCSFGGKAFAIAAFGQSSSPGGTASGIPLVDALNPITLCYYNGSTIVSCFQGLNPFSNSVAANVGSVNPASFAAAWFYYVANFYLGVSGFVPALGPTEGALSDFLSTTITGPINSPFTIVTSDSMGEQVLPSTLTAAAPPITGVGATTTFYFTKGTSGSINTLTNGLTNLITSPVSFATSLFQTATNLVNAINQGNSGYTAQVNYTSTTIVGITITAPIAFGAAVNAQNISINTTTIFTSAIALQNNGAAGSANYALAGGVTATVGQSQIVKVAFNDLLSSAGLPQGTYQADLVFNSLTYSIGAGNLTRKRPTFVFFLQSGGSGSVGPITLNDGTNLLSSVVNFATSLTITAQNIAANVNAKWGGAGIHPATPTSWGAYWTQVQGIDAVVIQGPSVNSPIYSGQFNVAVTATTINIGSTPVSTPVSPLILSITTANTDPTFAMALAGKLYLANGTFFNFSASYDATRWERQDTGAGFIQNVDQYAAPSDTVAFAPFQGKLAVFSRSNVVIWNYSADPNQYSQFQSLPNIGTMAKLSVQPLGDLDVLFLHDSGYRSLRVREATLNAFVNDIGSAIDEFVQASLIAGTALSNAAACSIVDPSTGRYWGYLNGVIYVLSYYPSLKIVAWSTYSPTYITAFGSPNANSFTYNGLTVGRKYFWVQGNATSIKDSNNQQILPAASGSYGSVIDNSFVAQTTSVTVTTAAGPYTSALYEQTPFTPVKFLIYLGQVYVLDSNNNVYVYGGTNNNTYDGTPTYVTSPWLDLKNPQMDKQAIGIQASMSGAWVLAASMDPFAGDLEVVKPDTGTATGVEQHDSTFDQGSYGFDRVGTHLQFQAFTPVTWTQPATFSSFTLRYNPGTEV